MTATAYLVHLHAPFGHARHYLGWSEQLGHRLGHHAAGTGSNLLRHVKLAGVTWSLVRVWPGASRTTERRLHDRGSAARLCPVCEGRRRRVQLPAGGYLEPASLRPSTTRCSAPSCTATPTHLRPYGHHRRGLCEPHACAYAARQAGATPFTTVAA